MGTVWKAVHLITHRQVALKLLGKGAFTSEKDRARFEREVELTARLQHPNIARLYDSDLRQGVYHYAMELIDGVPLEKYVQEHGLTHREVLELMKTACLAVQHAHERGVIHRDLKPSNILVTEDGQPHILDFGLAKSFLEGDSRPPISSDGEAAGTPPYMSPEQAAGHVDQIDTRTDVYALGVILFRLLTGESPHDLSGTRYEVLRGIAEEEVRRPREITRNVDRELEALLLKALAHDPKNRYLSAGALAQDIENYLTGEPLSARPPTTVYFLLKRIKKYRVPVAATALVLAVLASMAVFAFIRIARERNRAVAAGDKAKKEADKANVVYEFLGDVLSAVEPTKTHGREVTLRESLDQAAKDVAAKFANQPEVEAKARGKIGAIYSALGEYQEAEKQYAHALEIRRRVLGGRHPETLASMYDMAKALNGVGKLRESEMMHRRVLELRRRVLGEKHRDTLMSLSELGCILRGTGKLQESEKVLRKALEVQLPLLGEEDKDTLHSMWSLATTLRVEGKFDEAEEIAKRLLDIERRVRGEEDLETVNAMANLALTLSAKGRLNEAEALQKRVLETRRRVLGENHPRTLESVSNLASTLYEKGNIAEAQAMWEDCLETQRHLLGEEHLETAASIAHVAIVLAEDGKLDEAEGMLGRALDLRRRLLGEEHRDTLSAMSNLANILSDKGKLDEAEEIKRQVLVARRRVLGEEHPDTLRTMSSLASTLSDKGELDEAEVMQRQVLEAQRRVLGEEHPDTLASMNNLANTLRLKGKFDEAEVMEREALEARRRIQGEEHPDTARATANLANTLLEKGKLDEAEALLKKWIEVELSVLDKKAERAQVPFELKTARAARADEQALGSGGDVLAFDGFDEKLALDWKIRNPDPSHYSLGKATGNLMITTQKGDLWRSYTDYENLFLIDCPRTAGKDSELTTCISSFDPVAPFHQAGLILYKGDDDYLKFVYESGGEPRFAVGFETGGVFRCAYFGALPGLGRVWLRVTKLGNCYVFSTSFDGKRFFPTRYPFAGRVEYFDPDLTWGDGAVRQVGLVALNGWESQAPEIDASFDFFEVRAVLKETEPAPKGPLQVVHSTLRTALFLMSELGLKFLKKAEFSRAEAVLRRCVEVQRQVGGDENGDILYPMMVLADTLADSQRLAEAEQIHREMLEIRQRLQGEEHPDTLILMDTLAALQEAQRKFSEREEITGKLLEIRRRVFGEEHPTTLASMMTHADALGDTGKYDEAEALLRQCLQICRRALGGEHPDTLDCLLGLATTLVKEGKAEEAEPMFREGLNVARRVLGEEHRQTLRSAINLGAALFYEGKFDEAEALTTRAFDTSIRVFGKEHPDTLECMMNLGRILMNKGNLNEAEAFLRQCLDVRTRVLGAEHPDTLKAMGSLGIALRRMDSLQEAEATSRRCLELRQRVLGDKNSDTLGTVKELVYLALALHKKGKSDKAEAILRQVLQIQERVLGGNNENTLTSMVYLARAMYDGGRPDMARAQYEKAYSLLSEYLKERPKDTYTHYLLGSVCGELDKLDECEREYSTVIQLKPDFAPAYNNLGFMWIERNLNLEEAIKLVQKAVELDPENAAYMDSLGWGYFKQGKLDEALAEFQRALKYDQSDPGILDHVGDVYEAKGMPKEAVQSWQRALEMKPDDQRIKDKIKKRQESLVHVGS
jgi:tetratricopeptide (TPR) repeat protein